MMEDLPLRQDPPLCILVIPQDGDEPAPRAQHLRWLRNRLFPDDGPYPAARELEEAGFRHTVSFRAVRGTRRLKAAY